MSVTQGCSLFIVCFALISPFHVFAQDLDSQLDTMTVTAQKQEEYIQDVPISMNALSAIELESAGIGTTSESMRYIPNVNFKTATMENIMVIRGVSSVDGAIVGPVGVYVDDVSYPLHFMHNFDLLDVERLELLRGPQGTLYGRNTEAGVLKIETQQPDNQVAGKVVAEYGFHDTSHGSIPHWKSAFSLRGPVVEDTLFMGVSGQLAKSDGFMENTRLGTDEAAAIDHQNLRANVVWRPAAQWEISFIADYSLHDDKQGLYRIFSSDQGLKDDENTETRGFYDSKWEQKSSGQVLKVCYEGLDVKVLSITGRRDYEQDSMLGTGVGLYNYGNNLWQFDDDYLSQEIRISSQSETSPLRWLMGIYGFHEETNINFSKFSALQIRDTDIEKQGVAVFAQATYTLANALHMTVGGRFDHISLKGKQRLTGTDWEYNDISANYAEDLDYNEFLPKIVVGYDLTDDMMTYASVTKGYLEGGYNYGQAEDLQSFVFDPEYTWNYEIGIKSSWLDKRAATNLSLFYINMKDKQVSEYTAGGAVAQISNAAKAHSWGVELDTKIQVTRRLELYSSVGYVETEVDGWDAGPVDYSGNKMPNTPEYTFNIGAQYRHTNGLFLRADMFGTGSMFGNVQNDSHVKMDAYELYNLRAGYESESYDIIFWCKNVLDQEYYTSTFDYGDPNEAIGVAQNGEPRSFGVTLTYRF